MFLTFLTRCFVLAQWNCVVSPPFILPFYMLPYIFLLILYFIRRYTNFQKRFIYSCLLRKFLEILQFFQYTKIYEAMENVGIALFYRICVVALIITMRLLILEILCGDESLFSIFHCLCKAIVSVYYSLYLTLLLSKKILSRSLHFIKLLMLCTLRLIILSLKLSFYLAVLYLLSVFLTSNMSCIDIAFDANATFMIAIFNQNLRLMAKILNRRSCFQSLVYCFITFFITIDAVETSCLHSDLVFFSHFLNLSTGILILISIYCYYSQVI